MADMEGLRFVTVYQEGTGLSYKNIKKEVIVDKITGVNYLFCHAADAGGLTPLLDKDGKPVVTLIENKEN